MFYTNNNSLYSIGLPKEEKIIRSGVVISDILKEYYERGDLGNKLKKVTNITNPSRQSYNIYTYFTGPSYMSLLSAIDNDKGVRQEFYYPNTSNFQETIPGFIVKYDQTRTQSNFYHCGYQMQPFKTLTIYNNPSGIRDTLINYSSYSPDGTLQFAVDENGLHSAFAYDKVGRLISAALPGSFQDGKTSFVPNTSIVFSHEFTETDSRRYPGTYRSSTIKTSKPLSIDAYGYNKTELNEIWVDNTNYYGFWGNAGYKGSSGIIKVAFRIVDDRPAGQPRTVIIEGIDVPYSGSKEYSGVGTVTVEIPKSVALGEIVDLEIDITSILSASGGNLLYGIKIGADRYNYPENYNWELKLVSTPEVVINNSATESNWGNLIKVN